MRGYVFASLIVLATAEWSLIQSNVAEIAVDITAPNERTVWACAMANGRGPYMLKSTDGGETFTDIPSDPQVSMVMFLATAAHSDSNAVVAGMGFVNPVQFTTDGTTFVHTAPYTAVGMSESIEAIPGTEGGYVQVGDLTDPFDGSSHAAVSTDGGATFTLSPLADSIVGYGRAVSAVNSRVFYATGSRLNNREQNDDGITWLSESKLHGLLTKDNMTKSVWGKWGKKSNKTAAVSRTNTVAKTTDGGQTWENVYTGNDPYGYLAISCPSETTCFVLGTQPEAGNILRSTDGGVTWEHVHFIDETELYSIEFVSEREGWACGAQIRRADFTFDALFLHTTDGGATWTESRIEDQMCQSISMVNERVGYGIGPQYLGQYSIYKFSA